MAEETVGSSWHSYGSIYNLGHRAVQTLFAGPVLIEEKVDGSQFSFGVFNGELRCRSKGQELNIDAPEKMFTRGVEHVKSIAHMLHDGWTYRGEYLQSPKHNTLTYNRTPSGYVVIFDIATGEETYLDYKAKQDECVRIGLEIVPCIYDGIVGDSSGIKTLLDRESFLGGPKIEGIVIKNYAQFGPDKKTLMGKHVSESFREAHGVNWKASNPQGKDIIQSIIDAYKTEARWVKAIGHLRDNGQLDNSPKDIGALLREVQIDVTKECEDEIKRVLYKWAKDQIMRGIVNGLPEWYKNRLMEGQFSGYI